MRHSDMFGKTAIVKPDHVGDLILAAPAVGRLAELSAEITLFVASGNTRLAMHLFPELEVRALDFPHLAKDGAAQPLPPGVLRRVFAPFRTVFVLRSDVFLNRSMLRAAGRPMFFTAGRWDMHDVRSHAECLYGIVGPYESDSYWPGRTSSWPSRIDRVALVVGAGFPTNRWAAWHWARLAILLRREGCSVLLVGGPAEDDYVATISQIAGLEPTEVLVGTADNIPDLLGRLAACDVAVATDGGSGHIASLACPVLSLFTSSPYRRFAPFGRENRLITLDLACSPCMNADDQQVNLCLTHECSFGILPETVLTALGLPNRPPGTCQPLGDPYGARLVFAPSHG